MKLKRFLQAFGLLAVLLSLFPLVASDYWWIRMFDFPHVQLTTLTFLALLIYFIRFEFRNWRDYVFVLILSACFVFQLVKIYPYTPLAAVEVLENRNQDPKNVLSLLASNVLQKNKQYHRVIDEVLTRDPDLLIFTETDQKWRDELSKGLKGFGYDYRLEEPLDNTYGMLLYSRLPLLDPKVRYLIEDSIPSMSSRLRLPSGALVQLHILHPTPPMPPHDATSTSRDAQMMMIAEEARKTELPVIVAGDFNDVAWSETTRLFRKASTLLDPRIGRGFFNTYNANSLPFRWPLDHIFVSEDFRLVEIELGHDLESDHFPLYVKLSLEPEHGEPQEAKEPSFEEKKEAREQIENGKEKAASNPEAGL